MNQGNATGSYEENLLRKGIILLPHPQKAGNVHYYSSVPLILFRQPTFLAVNFVYILGTSSRLFASTDNEEARTQDSDGDKYSPQYSNDNV